MTSLKIQEMKKIRSRPTQLLMSDKPAGSIASFPALALEQNGQKFYFATIPKEDIFPFCYVAGREEDPQDGFQRNLDSNRARDIARYLDDSIGSIPTNVVLSAQFPLTYIIKKYYIKFDGVINYFNMFNCSSKVLKSPLKVSTAIIIFS